MTTEAQRPSDDAEAIASSVREAADRNAQLLREQQVPIAIEPPTVFRP